VKRLFLLSVWMIFLVQGLFAQSSDTLHLRTIIKGLDQASSLYITPMGRVYITEKGKNRLLITTTDGQRIDSLGNLGNGDFQFDTPTDVDATNGLKIYVADYHNHRIQIFDRRNQYLSTIRNSGQFGSGDLYAPKKLCVNNRGEIFFFDDNSRYIVKYNSRGQYDQVFTSLGNDIDTSPSDMIAVEDRIYISEPDEGIIDIISNTGQYLGFIGGVKKVGAIATDGHLLWACLPGKIKVFEKRGSLIKKITIFKEIKPIGLSIHQDRIFLLTADRLYKIREPKLR
jgi:hypothetical protein